MSATAPRLRPAAILGRAKSDLLAAVKTVQSSGGRISASNLSELKIAVSFLGPLEQTEPRHEADF